MFLSPLEQRTFGQRPITGSTVNQTDEQPSASELTSAHVQRSSFACFMFQGCADF